MQPSEDRKLLPQGDFVTIFGDLKSIIQVFISLPIAANLFRLKLLTCDFKSDKTRF